MAVVLSGGREAVIFACAAVGTKADIVSSFTQGTPSLMLSPRG
jgi:hypothetical protein